MISSDESCGRGCVLNDFFKNVKQPMYITTCEGLFIKVNRAMEQLLGYAPNELSQLNASRIYACAEDRERFSFEMNNRERVHNYRIDLRDARGKSIPCFVDAILWKEEGVVFGYHGIIRSQNAVLGSYKRYFQKLQRERKVFELERRKWLGDSVSLARHLSPGLLSQVEEDEELFKSARRNAVILFFDIRGSTRIAQKLPPETFAEFLNDILTDIIDLICGNKGVVNKLLGDGLMASFGCPVSTGRDAYHAVSAGTRILEYLSTYNDVRPDYLSEPLKAGIGIASGEVFAGIAGSVRCREYTVLGDPVNLSSRLQELTKEKDFPLLMGPEVYESVRENFEVSDAGTTPIRGRRGDLQIYGIR